jgi:hypothetical protein
VRHTVEDGLRAVREATRLAALIRIDLDDKYRRAIAIAESLPDNQSGADKTRISRADARFHEHYRRVRRP